MSPKIIKRETQLEIRIGLEADEREPLTKELLQELNEIDTLRVDAANTAATFRKQINEHTEKAEELRTTLEQGKPEMRNVIAHFDFAGTGRVRYQDAETKKFYKDKEREITDEDRQLNVGDEEASPSEPGDGDAA